MLNNNIEKETPRSEDNTNREVAIYDNDEAYMLDDDKNNFASDPERIHEDENDNLDMELLEDMNHQLTEEDVQDNYRGVTDEDTIRNKASGTERENDLNSNYSNKLKQRLVQNDNNLSLNNESVNKINNERKEVNKESRNNNTKNTINNEPDKKISSKYYNYILS